MQRENILLLLVSLAVGVQSFLVLEDKAYLRLNDVNGGHTINASTYNRLDFDYNSNLLYVTAKEPGRLTVYRLELDGSPTLLTEVVFNIPEVGKPLDVEFCRPNGVGPPRVAISFEDPHSASADGVVRVYHALTPIDTDLTLIKEMAVGPEPVDIEFTEDCTVMLVANRGRPTKEGSVYRDPVGSVTKIAMPPDLDENSPVVSTTINFDILFSGPGSSEFIQLLQESNFRIHPPRQPDNTPLTIMQNLEPEKIIIAPNFHTAYVSLPKNNAIAQLNLDTNLVATVIAMGNRSWTDYYLDPSDMDGEINMRGYNIHSLLQPTDMVWLSKDGTDWIVTLDTGRLDDSTVYGNPDYERGKVLMQNGDIVTPDSVLQSQLLDDRELGRLLVSTADGKRGGDGKLENVFAFGGRGFSVHNPSTWTQQSGVVDNIEQVSKQFFRGVFNTAYVSDAGTPMSNAEATSTSTGPNLGAMTAGDFKGKTLLFLGSATSGILYVYQLAPDANCPQPIFHSVHRAGSTVLSWSQAYNQGTMGDIGITDMMYLSDGNLLPILVVASATSNSVSIYSVVDGPFNPKTRL